MTGGAAYYLLTRATLLSTAWPAQFQNYSLFIASAALNATEVDSVHKAVPGAKVLAYYCSSWVYLGAAPCSMDRYDMKEHFNASLAITNLDTKQPACITFGPSGGVGGFVFSKASVDAIAAYHRDVTLRAAAWDGIYLDELDDAFPSRWKQTLLKQTTRIDIDGDGKADLKSWRPSRSINVLRKSRTSTYRGLLT